MTFKDQCNSTIKNHDGDMIRCEKVKGHTRMKPQEGEGENIKQHSAPGYYWKTTGRFPDKKPHTFSISGLWLTSGGRIVKPGPSESCNEPYDAQLMTFEELQEGIPLKEFRERLNRAARRRRRRR